MPRTYNLKTSTVDKNRIQKFAVEILKSNKDDRDLALDAYKLFKERVQDDGDNSDKDAMVECLKLAQTAKNTSTKLIDYLIKLEIASSDNDGGDISFDSIFE